MIRILSFVFLATAGIISLSIIDSEEEAIAVPPVSQSAWVEAKLGKMTLEEKMKMVGDTSYFTKVILFGGLSLLLVLYLQFYYWFGLRRMQNSYSKLIIIH